MTDNKLFIFPVPALKDNYIWTIIDRDAKTAIVVDPGEAQPIINFLTQEGISLSAILVTHHHYDHTGGIIELCQWQRVPVFGAQRNDSLGITHPIKRELTFTDHALSLKTLPIPGHTQDHTAFYNNEILFCGDTLFSAGCGRIFEGTYQQMYSSLKKLATLRDETEIYCGHEYTVKNLQFASIVEPYNQNISAHLTIVNQLRKQNKPTLPSTMRLEKKMNPFLRCHEKSVLTSISAHMGFEITDPIEAFRYLREWKNQY